MKNPPRLPGQRPRGSHRARVCTNHDMIFAERNSGGTQCRGTSCFFVRELLMFFFQACLPLHFLHTSPGPLDTPYLQHPLPFAISWPLNHSLDARFMFSKNCSWSSHLRRHPQTLLVAQQPLDPPQDVSWPTIPSTCSSIWWSQWEHGALPAPQASFHGSCNLPLNSPPWTPKRRSAPAIGHLIP